MSLFIKQITPMSCSLACLESFLSQYDETLTQKKFIDDFPELTHAGTEEGGKIHSSKMADLGLRYNFKVEEADTEKQRGINEDTLIRLFNSLSPDQAVLIGTRFLYRDGVLGDYMHCFRFLRLDGSISYLMDPIKDKETEHSLKHILDYQPIFLKLTWLGNPKSA